MKRVYFLRPVGQLGPVKIGCSQAPEVRLREYSRWSPIPLELAASIAGSHVLERRFHARFFDQLSHHEWFNHSADMEEVILAIRAGEFDVTTLPGPLHIPSEIYWTNDRRARQGAKSRAAWSARLAEAADRRATQEAGQAA